MSKSNVLSVLAGVSLATLATAIKAACGQKGDSAHPDQWFAPETPVALRMTDGDGNEAIGYLEGVRAARGGPNSEGAGTSFAVRVIRGSCEFGGDVIERGSVFALHSKDAAAVNIEALSLRETMAEVLSVAGIQPLNLSDARYSVANLLGIAPKAKPEPKPVRAPRTGRVVVAQDSAPSRFAGARATDLSNSPALDALDAATDSETAEG